MSRVNEATGPGDRSNVRGTISTAEGGNGGTSQWFINMRDNSSLDDNFKVMAQVLDMTIPDRISALPVQDLDGPNSGNIVFDHVPYLEGELVHVLDVIGEGRCQRPQVQ